MEVIFDSFCFKSGCEHYIEWQYSFDEHCRPIDCTSCRLNGQSHNITEIPIDCPFMEQIKEYENSIINPS